jgi:hypothetical protein
MLGHANRGGTRPWGKAILTIDATTAHISVSPAGAEELLAFFQGGGVSCCLRRQGAVGGLDLIDFGNPSARQERPIRVLFADWLAQPEGGRAAGRFLNQVKAALARAFARPTFRLFRPKLVGGPQAQVRTARCPGAAT